jgi:phosphoglycolate phosphatase-like HAD superfamily hydrolase
MAASVPAKLILFDVDGTLMLSGGAGVRAMNRAFEGLFGVPNAFEHVPMAGRTDQAIVLDALARHGVAPDDNWLFAFRDAYCARLREEIERPAPRKQLMPGVRALLDLLAARADLAVGLLTGNFAEGARIKLAYFDLARHFDWGAFGDDAVDRNALVPIALARAAARGAAPVDPCRVFVVGDTPLDVECALAAGVRAVAVATGPYDVAALHASGAHDVFADLSDARAFLQVIDR